MKRILNFIENFEENIITVLLPLMCIIVFMATFFRYTKLLIIPWAEELSRYLLVWIIFLGIGTGAKRNAHFAVEVFVMAMPKSVQKYFLILRTIIVAVFLAIIISLSFKIISAQRMMGQTSPALNMPMWLAYLAIPVGCGFMLIRFVIYLIRELRGKNPSEPDNPGEVQ